ncbi:MAG: TetR/AcrR family transcriptional regulator [Bacteroidetes bacterium]|nr:TetR/AcrR family transcriptional regulator [Bacteroidota bacterium]
MMETKDRIVKGAEELFFKYGIKSITMDDIAKHLAVSKKTIYQYFADKNELVEILMTMRLKEDECEFQQIHQDSENMVVEFFNMMKHMGVMFAKINPIIFYDLQKYHPTAWKLFKEFKQDCMARMVESTIDRGIKEGLVRSDLNAKILSRLRIEQVEMGFDMEIFPPDKFKMLDVQIALIDHFLYGICTLKGHKLINKYKQVVEEE